MNTQLLCTFTNINNYSDIISDVRNFYSIVFGKVYVLQNKNNLDELLLTYNIDADKITTKKFYVDTISVHRKKNSNTLYTINSLNQLIKELNNGKLDINFSIDWNLYKNSVLLTDGTSYKKVKTRLFKIISI